MKWNAKSIPSKDKRQERSREKERAMEQIEIYHQHGRLKHTHQ